MPTDIAFADLPATDQAHIVAHHRSGILWVYEPPDDTNPAPYAVHVAAIAQRGWWQEWQAREPEIAARIRDVILPEEMPP